VTSCPCSTLAISSGPIPSRDLSSSIALMLATMDDMHNSYLQTRESAVEWHKSTENSLRQLLQPISVLHTMDTVDRSFRLRETHLASRRGEARLLACSLSMMMNCEDSTANRTIEELACSCCSWREEWRDELMLTYHVFLLGLFIEPITMLPVLRIIRNVCLEIISTATCWHEYQLIPSKSQNKD